MNKWTEFIVGQKEPDMSDPKNQERAERIRGYGRAFGEKSGFSWAVGWLTRFANRHQVLFMSVVFAILIGCFVINAVHLVQHYSSSPSVEAVERLDSLYNSRLSR